MTVPGKTGPTWSYDVFIQPKKFSALAAIAVIQKLLQGVHRSFPCTCTNVVGDPVGVAIT